MVFSFLLKLPSETKWLANQFPNQLIKPLVSTGSKVLIPEPSTKHAAESPRTLICETDILKFNFNIIPPSPFQLFMWSFLIDFLTNFVKHI